MRESLACSTSVSPPWSTHIIRTQSIIFCSVPERILQHNRKRVCALNTSNTCSSVWVVEQQQSVKRNHVGGKMTEKLSSMSWDVFPLYKVGLISGGHKSKFSLSQHTHTSPRSSPQFHALPVVVIFFSPPLCSACYHYELLACQQVLIKSSFSPVIC